jgi:hypothetical protein
MKVRTILTLCGLSVLCWLTGGCASNNAGVAAADPTTQKNGHWVTLPPQTGSMIPRKVWVDDNGESNASPSMNNVENGSAAAVQKMQKGYGTPRGGGS